MTIAITVIHVIACLFLIGVVLLQQGKGADMGAVFGGSSQTIFGSSGAGNFLTRLTAVAAATFMLTSLSLTYTSARSVTATVFDDAPIPAAAPADVDTGAPIPDAEAPMPAAGGVAPDAGAAAQPEAPAEAVADAAAAAPAVAGEAAEAAPAAAEAAAENVVEGAKPGADAQPAAPQ
jgi:preprotein translocase subunit SecG